MMIFTIPLLAWIVWGDGGMEFKNEGRHCLILMALKGGQAAETVTVIYPVNRPFMQRRRIPKMAPDSEAAMITLNTADLKPGMILARPVRNRQGVLLMEAGAKMTKKSIRIFKSWGVNEIVIKGKPDTAAARTREGEFKGETSVERRLKEKFSEVMDDPIMVAIFDAAGKRLAAESRFNESEDEPS